MKKSKQAGKYILSDFISASVAWLLFNILRYEVLFAIDEGADSLLDYLQYPGVLGWPGSHSSFLAGALLFFGIL